jgi:hypothetical protein
MLRGFIRLLEGAARLFAGRKLSPVRLPPASVARILRIHRPNAASNSEPCSEFRRLVILLRVGESLRPRFEQQGQLFQDAHTDSDTVVI